MMKRAIAIGEQGIGSIRIEQVEVPVPGPGEALVRLTAATLNYRDLLIISGRLPGLARQPTYVPVSCATGQVIAVGEGVSRVTPGDRVNPIFAQGWVSETRVNTNMLGGSVDGVARTHALFDAETLCIVPDELGDLEAATLPCAGLTAWSALFGARPIQPGEWVLAPGTGGVSLAALQWAKAAGAHVAITSSSDAKLHRAKAMGADVIVNYRTTPDWPAEVRSQIGGGIDIVVDVVGTAELDSYARLLNAGSILAAIGMLDGTFSWSEKTLDGHPVVPIGVGNRAAHEAMLAFAARHAIRPVIDVVYDLDRLADALRHLESQAFFGKIGINLL